MQREFVRMPDYNFDYLTGGFEKSTKDRNQTKHP